MGPSAVESVGDAVDVTREFLAPFSAVRWLKLSAVVFLLSGGGLSLSAELPPVSPTLDPTFRQPEVQPGPAARDAEPPLHVDDPSAIVEAIPVELLALGLAALVAAAVAFAVLQSLAEFVFVESLATGDVSIRRHARRRWRGAAGLFAFRFAVRAATVAVAVGALVAVLETGVRTDPLDALVLVAPVAALVVFLGSLVDLFATAFVVPVMIREDCGVVRGWRRFWSALTAHPLEFLLYAVVRIVLAAVLAGVALAAVVAVGSVVALPLALVGVVVVFAAGVGPTTAAGLAVLAVLAAVLLCTIAVAAAFVQVPVQSYLRYYALLVLGDVDSDLDLIPERRRRARERTLGVEPGGADPADR